MTIGAPRAPVPSPDDADAACDVDVWVAPPPELVPHAASPAPNVAAHRAVVAIRPAACLVNTILSFSVFSPRESGVPIGRARPEEYGIRDASARG
jgi:hypothetical protein